jgi:hypothetical protein
VADYNVFESLVIPARSETEASPSRAQRRKMPLAFDNAPHVATILK